MSGHLVIGIFSHVSKNQNIKFKEYILNTNSETVKIIVEKEFISLSTVMYNSKIAEEEDQQTRRQTDRQTARQTNLILLYIERLDATRLDAAKYQ